MCGRFQQSSDLATLQDRFAFRAEGLELRPRWNLAPGQDALVVRLAEEGRRGSLLRWGLVPAWSKDAATGYKMINARSEGIAAKPAFRGPFKRSRCLVPADAFYEWAKQKGHKQPYRLALADDEPFALAGLWDRWQAPEGRELESFTIITTQANQLVKPIHDRMPVMLARSDEDAWLDPASPAEALEGLLKPYPAQAMGSRAVSARLNSPANEGPELVEPVATQGGLFSEEGDGA
ncbi:MAG: SOS response-associated peptidase [Desulfarculaceae bacterium]|nr:SOS response-associated peptidase [Desulfarculaceae bacterium]MCF8072973.1 SOS response-associated peptidase [Desulfarculaceae bacterium]MCF8100731.1 SOS response-associated peptidase [Desulfarculaceae bacterium]MCF8115469.1 SOS response-associated peptidase [Desulfarculaceae bacterium]